MTRRALLAVLALALLLAAVPATASARQDQLARGRTELAKARALVDRAVDAARAGRRSRAYELARTAYLDHFEYAEIPLRLRDANRVLDLEFRFAALRNDIRDGASMGTVEGDARAVRTGLDGADRILADKGWAAPALAFGFSFTILFREGVEAVLLIAVLLGALEAGRAARYRRPLALGVGGAVVASIATFALTALVVDIAPLDREVLEAVMGLLAVAILVVASFWLVSRLEHRRWMEFMRARTAGAIAAGSAGAFAALGFTAVYREGFETALFYQALTLFAQGLILWVVLGVVAAAFALAGVGYAILGLGRRLPLKPMLIGGASVLLLLSVTFAGNAVRALQEGDVVSVTPVASHVFRWPVFLAELTGVHATREGLITQAVLLAIYVAGALYVFAWRPLRARRRASTAAAAA